MRSLVAVLCLGSGFYLAGAPKPPTLAEARAFLDRAQSKLLELSVQDGRADWVKSTYITYDTEILAAKADEDQIAATMQLAKESTRFSQLEDAGGHGARSSSCCASRSRWRRRPIPRKRRN